MTQFDRTYRTLDDGEVVEGTWRHIFIHNGPFHLSVLKIFEDGLVDCWGLVDLVGFKEKVRQGWVATQIPEDGEAFAHHLGSWRFKSPKMIAAEQLIGEVADEIVRLRGEATTSNLCLARLDDFVANPSEENRNRLRDAYHAVPSHLRTYLLGDMDAKDWPIRVVVGDLGDREPSTEGEEGAMRYLRDRADRILALNEDSSRSDPDGPAANETIPRFGGSYSKGQMLMDGDAYLSNDAPVAVVMRGVEYPSATHAYWAAATTEPSSREAVRKARNAIEARTLGSSAPRTPHWTEIRLSVMLDIVRAKFNQHPELADRLVATGTARLFNGADFAGDYWSGGRRGRNWLGRVLEVVRSELIASRVANTT